MKNLNKDIGLLFIYSMSNTIFFIWPVIYPYLGSYVIHSNSDLTLKKLFSTTLGLVLGPTIGNLFLPKMYFLFGIKKTIQIGGFLNLLNCILYYKINSILAIFLNVMFSGAIYQLTTLSITYYLTEKFENGYIYCNYAFVGQNISNILWPYFALKLMNPENIGMTAKHVINGEIDIYFPWEISKNFPMLMNILGLISFLLTMISSYFLIEPKKMKPHFMLWVNAVIFRNHRAIVELDLAYKESLTNSLLQTSKSRISKSMISNETNENSKSFLEKELSDEEAEQKANRIMKHPLFIILVLILSIRIAPLYYLVDNFKVLSYPILKSDTLISIALSISSLFAILGQVFIKKIWEKLDFYHSFLFLGFLNILFLFIYLRFSVYSSFFMISNFCFSRILINLCYGAIYFTKFGLFDSKIAIYISKFFDLIYFISVIFVVGFNYLLFDGINSSPVFMVHLFINILSTAFFIFYFRNFKDLMMKI